MIHMTTQSIPDRYNLNLGERSTYRDAKARGKDDDTALMEAVGFKKFKEIQSQKDTRGKTVFLKEPAALKESFRDMYIRTGKSTAEAEKLAEIAAKGRDPTPVKKTSDKVDLEESFYQGFISEGRCHLQARRMAKIAVEGR